MGSFGGFLSLIGLGIANLWDKSANLSRSWAGLISSPEAKNSLTFTQPHNLSLRVDATLKADLILKPLLANNPIHVAESNSQIILTGSVSDPFLLKKIVDVAHQVTGVTKVNTNQVAIRHPEFAPLKAVDSSSPEQLSPPLPDESFLTSQQNSP